MLSSHHAFTNYLGQSVRLVQESWVHIREKHPEISIEIIEKTISNPDFVLMSEMNPYSELYFLHKQMNGETVRFSVVVVKIREDGLWVSTAMTKKKVAGGIEIYRREK